MDQKMKVSQDLSKYFNGYRWPRSTNISPGESVDVKESVRIHQENALVKELTNHS
jgi:hypothetical protein